MKSIRILTLITESWLLGGAQRCVLTTICALKDKGYHVELACGPGGPLVDKALQRGIPVTTFPSLVRSITPYLDSLFLFEIYRFLKLRKFDIIHTHSTKAGLLGRLAAKFCKVPVIIHTIHGTPFVAGGGRFLNKALIFAEKASASFTDKLIAVGHLVKKEFLDAGVCEDSKIEIIYSAIDFDRFNVNVDIHYKKKSLGIVASDALVVGTVGHLVTCKGHKYFIQAASQLVKVFPNIYFLIAGEGTLREELENQISHLNLESTVKLLGDRNDVPEILSIIDLYVQPSLWEGLPRTIVEAMYMKRPVIASAVNAIPELIEDGKTGILVPPKDVSALASAIEKLLENPDERKRLGENAYQRVFPEFSADLMVDRIEDLYLRLLAEKLPEKL